ncbi:MAG: PstS family phosphate ABC transporter substrate-binding protein [Thermomicrobiales bacterium]
MITGLGRLGKALAGAALAVTLASPLAALAQDAAPAPYTPSADVSSLSGEISVDGSSTVGPIMQALAEEFNGVASGVQVPVGISGTGGGFKRFCAGETDISNASRPIKDEEAATCEAAGISYYEFQIAYDGITVAVNPENTWVNCLTVAQLNQLWAPDSTVKNWSDLDPSWPAEPIALYGPGPDSGTFDYFTEVINGETDASRTDYTPSEDDNVLVQGIAGDKNALGYFGLAYYEENADSLKAVEVDGGNGCVAPSTETVRDGSYAPLSRPLFVYVKADSLAKPEVAEFLRFAIANGGAMATEVGFVASPDAVYVADQTKLEAALSGSGTPDGPAPVASPEA